MITVYCTEVFTPLKEKDFRFYLNKIEDDRRKKILLMKMESGRLRSLTAGSLLYFALCEQMGDVEKKSPSFSVGYGQNGKPYLRDYPDLHFNLSHSGSYVCCALGDTPVGVDIQKITDVKKGIAERFFTEEDNQKFYECSEKESKELFFRMWSIKESFIKLTGKGIAGGLDTFEIDWEKNLILGREKKEPLAHFMAYNNLMGYSACVCSWAPMGDVVWKWVRLEDGMHQLYER